MQNINYNLINERIAKFKEQPYLQWYSTDIKEAMKLFQELALGGRFCCIELYYDYFYTVECRLRLPDNAHENQPFDFIGQADPTEPALAICIAYCKVNDIDIEEAFPNV